MKYQVSEFRIGLTLLIINLTNFESIPFFWFIGSQLPFPEIPICRNRMQLISDSLWPQYSLKDV